MKHRGETWTTEEINTLKSLYENNVKISDISMAVNHTEYAVTHKIKDITNPNRRINWTEKEISRLTELFDEGKSYSEIAKELNKTTRACQGKAIRIGLKKKDCNTWVNNARSDFWSAEEIDNLKIFIESGFSASEIAAKLNRSKKAVFYQLKVQNLHIKQKTDIEECGYRRVYSIDDNYFEKIDTQMKAYFLGWMITDGYVIETLKTKRGVISSSKVGLKIQSKDIEILELFSKETSSTFPIKKCKSRVNKRPYRNSITGKELIIASGEQAAFEISSFKMLSDLKRYGVHQSKTYDVTFPDLLEEEFYPGFIAGVISGDGCVDLKKNHGNGRFLRITFSGNYGLLAKIKEILVKNINLNCEKTIRKYKCSKCLYSLELSQTESINLYYWLKENNVTLMSRKNKIIEDYLMEKKLS